MDPIVNNFNLKKPHKEERGTIYQIVVFFT